MGVSAGVEAAIEEELSAAEGALAPHAGREATPLLISLTRALREQVAALRRVE